MHPTSKAKRDKLELLLSQGVVRVLVAVKVPGVQIPEWWTHDMIPLDLVYANGIGVDTDDNGFVAYGLKFKGVPFTVTAPWASVVAIAKFDGTEGEEWAIESDEIPAPEQDENNVHLLEVPRHAVSRDDAAKVLHMLMMQLSQLKSDDMARFVLAKLPRGAYTGLKLVVDNTKQRTFKPGPTEPPPIHVA